MTSDEQWIRDRLAAVADVAPPPGNLAARAERAAGRIRRRRYGLAAGVTAVVAAVPLLLGGVGGADRSLPPAEQPDPACAPRLHVLPDQPLAGSAADVTWPLRGDPRLRPALERVMAGTAGGSPGDPPPLVRPLLAQPRPGSAEAVFAFASQLAPDAPWLVVARVLPATAAPADLAADAPVAAVRLPKLLPTTQVSLLVPVRRVPTGPVPRTGWDRSGNLLVALGAPGSDRVDYRACYRGRSFTVSGPGDVLVRDVGPVDTPGRIEVWSGTELRAASTVGLPAFGEPSVVVPAVEPVPAPAGTRVVLRLAGQSPLDGPRAVPATVPAATVLARCAGPAPLEVKLGDRSLGRVACDERVHTVAIGVALSRGRQLAADWVPDSGLAMMVPVAYDVVVVTAG